MYCAMEDQLSCETKQQLFITRPDVANLLCTIYVSIFCHWWMSSGLGLCCTPSQVYVQNIIFLFVLQTGDKS